MHQRYDQLDAPRPNFPDVEARYAEVGRLLDSSSQDDWRMAFELWDEIRKETWTWLARTRVEFSRATQDPERKAEQAHADALGPKLDSLDLGVIQALISEPIRSALGDLLAPQSQARWDCMLASYNRSVEDLCAEENQLVSEFDELIGGARITFRGAEYTPPALARFGVDADRQTRHDANAAMWSWHEDNADAFNDIFDGLVRTRNAITASLGAERFVDVGYNRMNRIGYGIDEVETFRAEVRERVVPLASELKARQAARLGLETLMLWDDKLQDTGGNPQLMGDYDALMDAAQGTFDELHPDLAALFAMMRDGGFFDLQSREGKRGGGFCSSFASTGTPFVFANFNGTSNDARVFTHEMGHAFQVWSARHLPLDLRWATMDAAEIHSMSLEFLTFPFMERFFGDDADRYRHNHLENAICRLPYMCAIDHFQHEIYDGMNAAERCHLWRKMERMYVPWTNYGDLEFAASGVFWQRQAHVYRSPFYYIDYALARTCSLQFWAKSLDDSQGAIDAWAALCARGGEAPFEDLVRSAGLVSPFEAGSLAAVIGQAERVLLA